MDKNNARKIHLANKAEQERQVQARIDGQKLLRMPPSAELEALATEVRASKSSMFSLLMGAGVSLFLLYHLMRPRQ